MAVGAIVLSNYKQAFPVEAATPSTLSAGSNSVAIKVNYNSAGEPASNNGVRISTSNKTGSATFTIPSGSTGFGFYAVGWNGKSVTATISASLGTPSSSSVSLTSNSAASGTISANDVVAITGSDANIKKTFTITGVTSASTITLSASSSEKRAIIWDAWYEVPVPATSVTVTGNDGTSLAPTETRQLSATVLPANHTDTITWSSSDDAVATVSSAGLVTAVADGTVTITARANASVSGTTTITVETPTSPYITPSKSSTSGYTGENELFDFLYGNLAGTLRIISSNTSIVTIGDYDCDAGEGLVQLNFVGAGSTMVKFKDGDNELASVDVSVTASSVSITGLPSNDLMLVGGTLNLGSKTTVTAVGSYSNTVTWASGNNEIATVNASGVVTGVSKGTVNITVTSNDYPTATMTCAVTVGYHTATLDLTTDTTKNASDILLEWNVSALYSIRVDKEDSTVATNNYYPGTAGKTYTSTRFYKDSVLRINPSINFTTLKVEFLATTEGYATALASSSFINATANVSTENTKKVIVTFVDDSQPIRVTIGNNCGFENVKFYYVEDAKELIENNLSTVSAIRFNYTEINAEYEFTGVGIRFGGFINKAHWDLLDDEEIIEGYGVLLATASYLGSDSIKDKYNAKKAALATDDVDAIIAGLCASGDVKKVSKEVPDDKEHPAEATSEQKAYLLKELTEDNYYIWTAKKNITDSEFNTDFVAVAYIKTYCGIVFLQETDALSAKDLAVSTASSMAEGDHKQATSALSLAEHI